MRARLLTIEPVAVAGPEADAILRAYFADIISRYQGRPAKAAEVDQVLADEPSDDLTPPGGVFLGAHDVGRLLGCVGVRLVDPNTAELTRMYVAPEARQRGLGRALIATAEAAARELGADVLRLDTRSDLVEARALYASSGFVETPPHNAGQYAEHWFAKPLR